MEVITVFLFHKLLWLFTELVKGGFVQINLPNKEQSGLGKLFCETFSQETDFGS